MSGEGVVAVWSGTECVSQAFLVLDEGIVLGRELVPHTTDDRISRAHARVDRVDDGLLVSDAGSRNGTHVNGDRLEEDVAEIVPGAVIRTGRTLWALVANVARFNIDHTVRVIVDAALTVASNIVIHPTFLERCLIDPPTHRPLLELVADAAVNRARAGGELRGNDLEVDARARTVAVVSGDRNTGAARRFALHLGGAKTRKLAARNSFVDARRGDRRVTILCPPNAEFVVELHDGIACVATGRAMKEVDALAAATPWLDGAALAAVMPRAPFLRRP